MFDVLFVIAIMLESLAAGCMLVMHIDQKVDGPISQWLRGGPES